MRYKNASAAQPPPTTDAAAWITGATPDGWFTEPPEVDTADFSTPWALVLATAALALLLLVAVAVVTSRWTVGRARYDRIREGG